MHDRYWIQFPENTNSNQMCCMWSTDNPPDILTETDQLVEIKDAFGIHSSPLSIEFAIPILPSPPIADFSPIHQQPTKKVYEKIKTQIDSLRLNDEVGVLQNEDGSIILRINDSILFKQGQTRVPSKSYSILRTLADIIRPLPMNLRIEGHTDDTSITGNSFGNWDLSVARAVSVLRFFSKSDLLALDRMAATGYGKQRPVVQNIDEATRALNRRVDFVLTLNESSLVKNEIQQNSNVPL